MSDHESPFDIAAALTASTELITEARAALIRTIEIYEATGPGLAKSALERIEWLNSRESSPARRDAAAGLIDELRPFDSFWVPLGWNAGALLFTLVNSLMALAMKMMAPQFPNAADVEGLDPISRAQAYRDASRRWVESNEILMASAVVAGADAAKAVLGVAGLLEARLDALDAFIHTIDQGSTVPDKTSESFGILSRIVAKEGLFLAAEEILKAAITELPKNVPVFGIAASVVAIGLEAHGKQKELHERREHLEQMARAYRGRGATDDMSIQLARFQQDNENMKELLSLFDELAHRLSYLPADVDDQSTPTND